MITAVRIGLLLLAAAVSASCAKSSGVIFSPDGISSPVVWSREEMEKEIAQRQVSKTQNVSHHVIRLRTHEQPHAHDRHDLTVFQLSGKARIHLNGKSYITKPGDVMAIPRGTVHWAENLDPQSSEVYAVFVPPYDGKDSRTVEASRPVRNPKP